MVAVVVVSIAAVVVGAVLTMGLIKNTKVRMVAEVAKAGLEQTREALVDDNKLDAKEVIDIFDAMVERAKELIGA